MDGLTNDERIEAWISNWKISLVGMAIVDKNFKFRRVNPQWVKILGVPATEFYGHSFQDITPAEIREADVSQANLVMTGMIDSYLTHKEYHFSNGKKKKVTLLVTRVPINTEKPFQFFLSRILLREDLDVKQFTVNSSNQKVLPTSKEKLLITITDFVVKYWLPIAIASAAAVGAANEFFQMAWF